MDFFLVLVLFLATGFGAGLLCLCFRKGKREAVFMTCAFGIPGACFALLMLMCVANFLGDPSFFGIVAIVFTGFLALALLMPPFLLWKEIWDGYSSNNPKIVARRDELRTIGSMWLKPAVNNGKSTQDLPPISPPVAVRAPVKLDKPMTPPVAKVPDKPGK
jgi:hypothetical protein